ncbi:MAG: class F sortase [Candidatus Saccharimonadales bacterium]
MPKQRTQGITQKTVQRLFMFVGVPVVSMCLVFLALAILMPAYKLTQDVRSLAIVTPAQKSTSATPVPIAGPPVRIQISRIDVDAIINPVGLTTSGAMDISENPDQTAWYQLGVIPGQVGSAVIAGHYGWGQDGHASVFNSISTLQKGDTVSVYDATGIETNFVVRESRLYDPVADATEVFTSNNNEPHLNLITCQGVWSDAKDSYSNRLVVFTDLKK